MPTESAPSPPPSHHPDSTFRPSCPGRPRRSLTTGALVAILVGVLAAFASAARSQEPFSFRVYEPPTAGTTDQADDDDRAPSTVILVPGLASPGAIWHDTASALARDGHRVHVLHLAGFAGQPPLDLPPADGRLDDRAADSRSGTYLDRVRLALLDHIDRLPAKPVVVGHSLGGTLALWTAASAPERVESVVAVDGVAYLPALMDPTTTPASAEPRAARLRAMIETMTPDTYDQQSAFTLSTMITDPADARRVAELSRGSHPPTVAAALYDLMTRDLRPDLAAFPGPILLVAAGALAPGAPPTLADQLEDRYRAQVAAAPDARVEVVENARHFVMVDAADRLLALLRAHLDRSARVWPGPTDMAEPAS